MIFLIFDGVLHFYLHFALALSCLGHALPLADQNFICDYSGIRKCACCFLQLFCDVRIKNYQYVSELSHVAGK